MNILEHSIIMALVFIVETVILSIISHERKNNTESKDCVKYIKFAKRISLFQIIIGNVLFVFLTITFFLDLKDMSIWWYVVFYVIAIMAIFIGSITFALAKNFRIYIFDDHIVKCNLFNKITEYSFNDISISVKKSKFASGYMRDVLKIVIRTINDNKKVFSGYSGYSIINLEKIVEKYKQWLANKS